MRLLQLIVAAFAATLGFSLTALTAEEPTGRRITIEIRKFQFSPDTPMAKPGDTIIWINRDIVPHTATADDGSWDSGTIEAGGRWEMVVSADFATTYFCRFHPAMTGDLGLDAQTQRGADNHAETRRPLRMSRLAT